MMNGASSNVTVTVNGDSRKWHPGLTIDALLDELGLDPRIVAVEHNREIVRRDDYKEVTLAPDDRLEIVRFVQGG